MIELPSNKWVKVRIHISCDKCTAPINLMKFESNISSSFLMALRMRAQSNLRAFQVILNHLQLVEGNIQSNNVDQQTS